MLWKFLSWRCCKINKHLYWFYSPFLGRNWILLRARKIEEQRSYRKNCWGTFYFVYIFIKCTFRIEMFNMLCKIECLPSASQWATWKRVLNKTLANYPIEIIITTAVRAYLACMSFGDLFLFYIFVSFVSKFRFKKTFSWSTILTRC